VGEERSCTPFSNSARPRASRGADHPPSLSLLQKQKKRSKAALDPSYTSLYSEDPASHILKLDYMSSEYSSEGDDAGLVGGRLEPGLWETLSGRDPDPTLNKGKGEKVLEIRTPMWRSQKVRFLLGA
jgi:hypothetical protein